MREDLFDEHLVVLHDLRGTKPGAQRERDDSTRRRAGDQVERVRNNNTEVLLELGQHVGSEQRLRAATIQGEDVQATGPRHVSPTPSRIRGHRAISHLVTPGVVLAELHTCN